MSSTGTAAPSTRSAAGSGGRLVGIDVARAVALLGMVATHLLDERTAEGSLSTAHALAAGRASALFAVLAGVSIALTTGRQVPVRGRERLARSAGLVVRALLIALLGLLLGDVGSGLAVILTYYGVLFLLALPFLGLGVRALAAWAVAAGLLMPVLSQLLRPALPPRGLASPDLAQLADPGQLVSELLLTGYYPALPWVAYLLAGMAIGRADLRSPRTVSVLVLTGAGLALLARTASDALLGRPGVWARLASDPAALGAPGASAGDAAGLRSELAGGLFGTTPTGGSWEWLLVAAPHSGTPFDLAATTGSALLVIGLALLLDRLPETGRETVRILAGAGAATLSLYTLHVLMQSTLLPPARDPDGFPAQVVVLVLVGFVLAAAERRGPLEAVVSRLSRAATSAVRRPARPDDQSSG